MEEPAAALYAAVADRLAPYVEAVVLDRLREAFGEVSEEQAEVARRAGRLAAEDVAPRLARLFEADVDEQRSTPLAELRRIVPHATKALDDFGVPVPPRDRYLQERFPEDRYALTPASMAVLGEEAEQLAIVWGAAKAMAHRRRHR